jgi:hypothetical protein
VDFLHQAIGQGIEKFVGIEAVVAGIEIEVLDVEEKSGTGLAADHVEKLGIGHLRIRPLEQVGYILEQERNGDTRLDRTNLGDDLLGDRLGLRQREEIAETAAGDPSKGEMLAVSGRLQTLDDGSDLIQIGGIEGDVGPNRKSDPVRQQWYLSDQIENRGLDGFSAADAVVDRDFENVEMIEVLAHPISYWRTIA